MKQGQAQITKAVNDALKAGGKEEHIDEHFSKIDLEQKKMVQNALKDALIKHMHLTKAH